MFVHNFLWLIKLTGFPLRVRLPVGWTDFVLVHRRILTSGNLNLVPIIRSITAGWMYRKPPGPRCDYDHKAIAGVEAVDDGYFKT